MRDSRASALLDSAGLMDIESYEDYAVATKFMVNAVMSDIEAGRGGSTDSLPNAFKERRKSRREARFEESDAAYSRCVLSTEKVSST